jgi:hypothetical protein
MDLPVGPQLDTFVYRVLNDSGYYCRNVIGMNTDMDADGKAIGEKGEGGIRAVGPHQEMVSFVDDMTIELKILLACRHSYKSSLVKGLIERFILRYPNCRILLLMHEQGIAENRVMSIRDELRNNPIIQKLFGDVKGPMWRKDKFITSLREDDSLLDPTLTAASPRSLPTGGHYDLIVCDDIVDNKSVQTIEGINRGIDAIRFIMPLRAHGGMVIDVGTLYAEGDAHHFLLEQPGWERLILDCGYDVQQLDDGRMTLVGDPRWPNLSRNFLDEQLALGYSFFMSQYKLQVVGGVHQLFKRDQFIPVSWKDEYKDLTGYLLTDVSTADNTVGALNVLAYVGLDELRRMHILDLEVGHWPIGEFCDRLLRMRARWSAKVNHQSELMEQNSANNVYRAQLHAKAKDVGQRLDLIYISMGSGTLSKEQRIGGLQPRFQAREVYVCNDTVPKTWVDESKIKTLWEPEGYIDPVNELRYPDGELVTQFTRFPTAKLRDIPDALAMIDSIDRQTGSMLCFYKKPLRERVPNTIVRKRIGAGGSQSRGTADSFYARASKNLGG